jgi:hypothetical protein
MLNEVVNLIGGLFGLGGELVATILYLALLGLGCWVLVSAIGKLFKKR